MTVIDFESKKTTLIVFTENTDSKDRPQTFKLQMLCLTLKRMHKC